MRFARVIAPLVVGSFITGACGKSAAPTADSPAASSTAPTASTSFDESAARHEILAADSAFVRAMIAKNVDSLMPYYDADAVSLGKTPVKGTSSIRGMYTEAVKNPPSAIDFHSDGVNFSNDRSMAWDYGTVSVTSKAANGKPTKVSGTFINVWKNVDGRWKIVAELSNTSP
jgi:ketosteroid isomerase-like protein